MARVEVVVLIGLLRRLPAVRQEACHIAHKGRIDAHFQYATKQVEQRRFTLRLPTTSTTTSTHVHAFVGQTPSSQQLAKPLKDTI